MPDGMKLPTPEAPHRPEKVLAPEISKEGVIEVRGEKKAPPRVEAGEKELPQPPLPVQMPPPPPMPAVKTQLQQDIEDILAEDLKELYMSLSPSERVRFKQEGEKAAARIEVLLKNVKVKISEILHLIRIWLSMLPGMNKFFLEKEVKIKTEQILELKENLKEEQ
ncbi:MAG: hypothetical protein AAB400_00840 [Patescibacteria group bacterium]